MSILGDVLKISSSVMGAAGNLEKNLFAKFLGIGGGLGGGGLNSIFGGGLPGASNLPGASKSSSPLSGFFSLLDNTQTSQQAQFLSGGDSGDTSDGASNVISGGVSDALGSVLSDLI